MKIAISLPVHENAEVVIDQINNIRFFVPESIIILHVSKEFADWGDYNIKDFEKIDNVLVNPIRFSTSYSTGILVSLHLSNFEFISENQNFDYFNLHSSNELFFKSGLACYLRTFEAGFFTTLIDNKTTLINGKAALKDPLLKRINFELGRNAIFKSQIEGSFYKKSIFSSIVNVIKNYSSKKIPLAFLFRHDSTTSRYLQSYLRKFFFQGHLYAKEEVYFPTIGANFARALGTPYSYMNWKNSLNLSKEELDNLMANDGPRTLNGRQYLEFFSVKRVNRVIDDPIRQYIRKVTKK